MASEIKDIPLDSSVTVKTKGGQVIKQHKYCNGIDGCTVLHKPGANRFHMNITLVKDEFIDSISDIKEPSGVSGEDYIPVVDPERTKLRESKAVRNAQIEADKIGEGVSEEAQCIFNALSKTLPCRWRGKNIIVLEEVEIAEPYRVEDCKSLHAGDSTVQVRVQKVLDEERKKLS
ncbi:Protein LSM12 [Picochlorum sp. SENEW3]|nr:Protein LSM12 [Picochlorum sp. SENEW3]